MHEVIVVTGGTSGIGLECCRNLIKIGGSFHLVVVGRRSESLATTMTSLSELMHSLPESSCINISVEGRVVDISNLSQVHDFALYLIAGNRKIRTLVCNAGVSSPLIATSVDGYDMTFATNQLGHFLLFSILQDHEMFLPRTNTLLSRIIIVVSALHDPKGKSGRMTPDISNWDMVVKGGLSGQVAYSTSKLCNVIYGHELQRRYGEKKDMIVYMYSPGFVPSTGLFRNVSSIIWVFMRIIFKCMEFWRPEVFSTPEKSGMFLAHLALSDNLSYESGSYLHIDTITETSSQSQDRNIGNELWDLSEDCVDKYK